MATAVTLLANKRRGLRIAGQLLCYPVTNANFETDSYQQFAYGPWLTRDRNAVVLGSVSSRSQHAKRANCIAITCNIRTTHKLASALIITAENDVLRDESEAYGLKLIEAGVEVVATLNNATIHDFMLLNVIASAAPTRAPTAQAVDSLKSVLAPA